MKTGGEAFEPSNLAPGHRMTAGRRREPTECPRCGEHVHPVKTGNPTRGNQPEYRCPECRATW